MTHDESEVIEVKSIFLARELASYASTATFPDEAVGIVSADRSAVIGRAGWCFIYEGGNNYKGAYEDETLAPLGDQWARLIEQRQRFCDNLGIRFLQLIVPNKATLMPENFPVPLGSGITTVLERLLKAEPNAKLVCPVEKMRVSDVRDCIFRRNDSHLTVAGNALLIESLLHQLNLSIDGMSQIEVISASQIGDLGGKFDEPMSELLWAPRFDHGLLDRSGIEKTQDFIVDGFNGTVQSFLNQKAQLKLKVLAFGNSFFERVPSWGMSPIAASIFKEFTFMWTPEFDKAAVMSVQPDIVICQTCERFLTNLQTRAFSK